ncbi:VWA domain-containing protein [Chitinimonas lacunae]|uniref:VWA domain-containing protein n=1 Tax=Chitinimonas lacunae TaxID=1963018 RepID=A0ABV8MPY4_9NEIS
MSRLIDLQKKSTIVLEKRGLTKPPVCRVGLALDVSGSMMDEYRAGLVQETVTRLLAYAANFDDNGEMEVWTFDHRASEAPAVSVRDYEGYVDRAIVNNDDVAKWGTTRYGDVADKMLDHYFRGKKKTIRTGGILGGLFGKKETKIEAAQDTHIPAMLFFISDGENEDRNTAYKIFEASQQFNAYWQLVGVSNQSRFDFLNQVANDLPNAGFVHLPDLRISDEVLYDKLITTEVVNWLKTK